MELNWVDDRSFLQTAENARLNHLREAREEAEKQRKEDVIRLRAEAQDLGQQLMDLRQRKFADEHAKRRIEWVRDPEIDVLEIRYQRVVRELEEKDQE